MHVRDLCLQPTNLNLQIAEDAQGLASLQQAAACLTPPSRQQHHILTCCSALLPLVRVYCVIDKVIAVQGNTLRAERLHRLPHDALCLCHALQQDRQGLSDSLPGLPKWFYALKWELEEASVCPESTCNLNAVAQSWCSMRVQGARLDVFTAGWQLQ